MKAKIINNDTRREWDRFVYEHPHSIAWQSFGWSEVVGKHYGLDFFPIAVFEGPRISGILPLYRVKGLTGKDFLISVPYAVAGGMLADDPVAQGLLLEKAIDLSRQFGSCRIALKQYKVKIEWDLRTDDNFYNRELSLSGDRDELWNRISEQNRNKTTEALQLGASLDYPSAGSETFYKLLLRHHRDRGIPCPGKQWIDDLLAFQMYSLALLKIGERVVAGTMVKEFKDTVSFPFTSLADTGSDTTRHAYALYWRLIEHFAARGKNIFHSGRIPDNDNAESYRLGWGGTKYKYFYQYYPNTETKTEYTVKRGRKRELVQQCWKRLPLGLTRVLGPRVQKYFP